MHDLLARYGIVPGQNGLPHGEVIVAREDQMDALPIFTHPFGRETGRFSWANIPLVCEVDRRPRAPRFGCIVDTESAAESRVHFVSTVNVVFTPPQAPPPQLALQQCMITHRRTTTILRMGKDAATGIDIAAPHRSIIISLDEEFVA